MMIVIHPVFNVDIAVYSVSMVITLVFTTLTCCSLIKTCFANCQNVCVYCMDIPITMNIRTIQFLCCESTITNVLSPLASYTYV